MSHNWSISKGLRGGERDIILWIITFKREGKRPRGGDKVAKMCLNGYLTPSSVASGQNSFYTEMNTRQECVEQLSLIRSCFLIQYKNTYAAYLYLLQSNKNILSAPFETTHLLPGSSFFVFFVFFWVGNRWRQILSARAN